MLEKDSLKNFYLFFLTNPKNIPTNEKNDRVNGSSIPKGRLFKF
jgi:hypothetical protein